MPRGDDLRLRDIFDGARTAVQTSAGRSQGDLIADRMLALGLTKLIEIIGEAASCAQMSSPCDPDLVEVKRTRDAEMKPGSPRTQARTSTLRDEVALIESDPTLGKGIAARRGP